nr:uncharacterized protein LOC128698672 [Cherax quadricarinatus]
MIQLQQTVMAGDPMRQEERVKGRMASRVPEGPRSSGSGSGSSGIVSAGHGGATAGSGATDDAAFWPSGSVPSPFTPTNFLRDNRLDYNVDVRTDARVDTKKQLVTAKSSKNGSNVSEDKSRVVLAGEARNDATGTAPGSMEKNREKTRSPGGIEGRSIIKDDSRRDILREQRDKDEKMKEARKEATTRRVSWVPGVTDNAAATRDKPAYKRRHSAVVKSSEVTFQRQRSFSLDSQQVRLSMPGSASWLVVPRPVISTENSTTRLTEPRGERDRSEPRYFTFSDVHPCTWEAHPAHSATTSGSGRGSSTTRGPSTHTSGGTSDPSSRFLVLNPDVPRERLVTYTSTEGARLTFADLYTRDYLYTLPVLFLAAARGNSAITYLLLKYGAAPAVTDAMGNTPLHIAACQMNIAWESVLDLLEYGAPISRANSVGNRALDLQPALVRLQEQLVLDCFATFDPPARVEPDPVTCSNRDLASGPVRQSSNLLRRLQGVASRDKTSGGVTNTTSSLRGRVPGGRTGVLRGEKEEDNSVSSSDAAVLQSTGSVRSRGGSTPGPPADYRSKVTILTPPPADYRSKVTILTPTPDDYRSKVTILTPPPDDYRSKVTISTPPLADYRSKVTISTPPLADYRSKVTILTPPPDDYRSKVTISTPPLADYRSR